MAGIKGTNVAAPVVPYDTTDVHPSHEARYGKGGYRTVATLVERDAIPAARREAGMLVFVQDDELIYQLGSDLTTWAELETGGGGGVPDSHASTHAADGSDPITVAGSQISGGALPASATLTFSDGTSDSEIGGWGFGVELTADGSVYATVEPSQVAVHGASGYASLQAASVYFSNGTSLAVGTFDSHGGAKGISLVCAVGYELNWQAGYLRCVNSDGSTQNILVESPLEFPGEGAANVQIDATGMTFADGTQQTTAWLGSLSYDDLDDLPTLFDGAYASLSGVPSTFDPSAHKTQHATGGSDALTASDIGAAEQTHTHAAPEVVFSVADRLLGRATAGTKNLTGEEIVCTAAARALLDDVDAAAQRTTLGLGSAATSAAGDFAAASHNHAASAITSGTLDAARLPLATTSVAGAVIVGSGLNVSSGTLSVASTTRLSDTVSNVSYIGLAPAGSATSASVWRIKRTTIATDGTVSSSVTATSVAWTNRLTASYS